MQAVLVPRLSFSEVIETRLVEREIHADVNDQVLAVDVDDRWAAVFRFSLGSDGEYSTEIELAQLAGPAKWEWLSSGGLRGIGWYGLPWESPPERWDGAHLLSFGASGRDVELDDGSDRRMVAVCGFASDTTEMVRVVSSGRERWIKPSPTGAFVAVAVGQGTEFLEVAPWGGGAELSPAFSYPDEW